MIKIGMAMVIPEGLYRRIAPRSGLTLSKGLSVGAGVIDSDYRGEIGVLLFNQGQDDVVIKIGDRVAHIIFEKIAVPDIEEAAAFPQTNRGDAGFGSTGVVNFVSKLAIKDKEEAIQKEHSPAHWGTEKIFWALKRKELRFR